MPLQPLSRILSGACLLLEELSLQRPPALTSADRAVLATYGMDAASV